MFLPFLHFYLQSFFLSVFPCFVVVMSVFALYWNSAICLAQKNLCHIQNRKVRKAQKVQRKVY